MKKKERIANLEHEIELLRAKSAELESRISLLPVQVVPYIQPTPASPWFPIPYEPTIYIGDAPMDQRPTITYTTVSAH